jgi:hypothetical protein
MDNKSDTPKTDAVANKIGGLIALYIEGEINLNQLGTLTNDALNDSRRLEREIEEYRSIAENLGAEKAVSERDKALAELAKSHQALRDLMPFVLEDYHEGWATPAYKAAVENAKRICEL